MLDFFAPYFEYTFLQNALLAILFSSIACGISGSVIVVKRISYLGGGIAHAVMGGIGAAYFLGIDYLYGAVSFAIIAALIIGWIKLNFKESEDTIISAVWAIGMAVGIILTYLTPGYSVDLFSFLFGNILMISKSSILLLICLDLILILVLSFYYKQIVFVLFDEEFSIIRNLKTKLIYLTLLIFIALTIVILVQTVGLILVIALLTLPSAIARMFSKSLLQMIVKSSIIVLLTSLTGLFVSYSLNIPTGATIILVTGTVYLFVFILKLRNT